MPDPVFRGMTKSAQWWGVPITVAIIAHMPFILITLYAVALSSYWQTVFIALLIVPNHLAMREITRSRPQVWRQIALWIHFNVLHRDLSSRFWHSSTYGPR